MLLLKRKCCLYETNFIPFSINKKKKAALVGISAGKFGNWLGLEHFGVVMNYLKINVFHQKVSIANIWKYMKDEVSFEDEKTEEYIKRQLEGFIKF